MSKIGSLIEHSYTGYGKRLWETITHPFEWENYFSYLIVISLAVWALELIFPWRKEQRAFRKDFWLDAFYMFFNFFIFNLIIFIALSNTTAYLFGAAMSSIGLPRFLLDFSSWSPLLQILIYFVLADFIQWSIHVALHRFPFMWRFHKVHHSVKEMGFAAHLRFHFMETVFYKTGLYIVLGYIFNFSLENAFIMHALTILIGHLNHANLALDYGPLKYVLNNPKMHIWHHAKELPKEHPYGMNYGISLSLWDYLFKTNYIPSSGRDIELGFTNDAQFPETFVEQVIYPFKKQS